MTLGAERRQSPTLGNGVFIGTGAKIIGPITIGDGARIGANAVVIDDVPPYATAISVPAQLVRMRSPSERVDPFSGPGPTSNYERN
ncbi:MAG TPA: hypothetical protein VGZ22_00710 [Isosphaeraceae bacterium]|nr:hypothetical protein [Isosphaeraceae bacterium]